MNRSTALLAATVLVLGCQLACRSSGRHGHVQGGRPVVRAEVLRGEVFYRERIALPRNAMLNVKLVERQRGRDRIITGKMISPVRRTPIPFELEYDPRQIDDRHEYMIDATILVDRKAWMSCYEPAPCLTRGHPREGFRIVVRRER